MDTALSKGDFLRDTRNLPIQISGVKEILQKVLIRLNVKKGSFIYDKDLGSNLYKLSANTKNLQNKARAIVIEALKPIKEVSVLEVLTKLTNLGENVEIHVNLAINEEEREVVITV